MLKPREADIPVLFLVLVVLPLVTYILLGKWNEATKNKARINILAQFAAEEAHRVETMACADVMPALPSPNAVFYECARCSALATTRCSRCKSVRYCSGKCQIIHWRQGHKQECQQWQDSSMDFSAGLALVTDTVQLRPLLDNSKPYLENDINELLHRDSLSDLPNDPSAVAINPSKDSAVEKKLSHSDERVFGQLRRETFKGFDSIACGFDDTISGAMDAELSSKDARLQLKFGTGYISPSNEIHRNVDRSGPTYAHAPTIPRNIMRQSHKLTDGTRTILKRSSSLGMPTSPLLDKNVINECETGSVFTSERVDFQEGQSSSTSETLDLSSSVENISVRSGIMYKKPPYILRPTTCLSQKSTEEASRKCRSQGIEWNADARNESRASQMNESTDISLQGCNVTSNTGGMKMAGSRKSSKVTKRNLLGLIKDYKKYKVLFPYEDLVKLFQCEVWCISPRGLLNCGNSCYANAVLQCLSCTKPLMVYLLQRSHSRTCSVRDWCLMCELEQHVSMLREGRDPLSPSKILSNINIGCRMGGGNQEDAHEFLRLLVMSMQSICLEGMGGEKEVNPLLQETTLIQQIFGGRLKSKVKCLRCHLESEIYENIMDLTLEIHGWVESLEDALTQFTAPEDLDGENMYRCERCSKYVKARKQLSVHEVPNILTIVLKRFQTGEYGKINKCVTFPDMLDMIPFVTGTADIPPLYMLYAVVVHLDTLNASFSGHYVSYVKDLQGTWFRIDDSEVQVVPLSQVMSEGAYMLFYSRSFPRPPRVYIEKASLRAPKPAMHTPSRTQKSSRHGEDKHSGVMFASNNSANGDTGSRPENRNDIRDQTAEYIPGSTSGYAETFADSLSMDFSDATSSDWSLFTSSDESSFTTESTRDSFSTVDYGDTGGLDTISSIFSPFYVPEYPHSDTVSCTKFSPSRVQTRFHSERKGFVLDSSMLAQPDGNVHMGRHPEQLNVSSTDFSLYGRCRSNPEDGFVQTSGFCDM